MPAQCKQLQTRGEAAASPRKAAGPAKHVSIEIHRSWIQQKLGLQNKSKSTQKKLEEVGPEIVQRLKDEQLRLQ